MLESKEYALFDEARALDVESQGGFRAGAMKAAADSMTMAVNDIDGDGRVSTADFSRGRGQGLGSDDGRAQGLKPQ